jgi:hypothetical protein
VVKPIKIRSLHEPSPSRGESVCANCTHVRKGQLAEPEFCEVWTCGAVPEEIRRPAGTDAITGEHVPAWVIGTRCTARNKHGECPDFKLGHISREEPPIEHDSMVEENEAMGTVVIAFVAGLVVGAAFGVAVALG